MKKKAPKGLSREVRAAIRKRLGRTLFDSQDRGPDPCWHPSLPSDVEQMFYPRTTKRAARAAITRFVNGIDKLIKDAEAELEKKGG